MKASILSKLEQLQDRYQELEALLGVAEVIMDQDKFRAYSKEYAELEDVVANYGQYMQLQEDMAEAKLMLAEDDADMKTMAEEEIQEGKKRQAELELDLQKLLLPKDPNDGHNTFVEIRAGTGGDEAAIFAGDLYRMYTRYAENMGWRVEIVSQNEGEHGGYREIITRMVGDDVYSRLKFESGAHRVQRVPETESQGRIHTSACTVAVMPEVDEIESIKINPADLRIDTFRASGAGGQHINKTDSAVRITHLPTGIVVECQDDRSQHRNKDQAMKVLVSRINDAQRHAQQQEQAQTRKSLVGTGDRSDRIRTYNFPQGRITDHRINLTLYKIDAMMDGDITDLLNALAAEHQADLLAAMGDA